MFKKVVTVNEMSVFYIMYPFLSLPLMVFKTVDEFSFDCNVRHGSYSINANQNPIFPLSDQV